MRIDLWVPTASPFSTPEVLSLIGTEAEQRGFGTIWVGEHVVLFDQYDSAYPYAEDGRIPSPPGSGLLEPLSTLCFLAAHTSTVRLGTAMLLLPQRNPVYTAKEISTLDWLSGGRVDVGIGVGWLQEEFDAVNVPWPQRGRRTDEYLEVLRTLWCDETSAFEGEFYSLNPCAMFPKPVQQPHPPIHVGGESDAALRRTARAGHGWHTFNRSPDELAAPLARLDQLLADEGRTRADVTITVCPYFKPLDADLLEQYAEAGADAVAALLLPLGEDVTREGLDALQPVLDRAATLA
jgi:probable F420-dependent oxidoreductase